MSRPPQPDPHVREPLALMLLRMVLQRATFAAGALVMAFGLAMLGAAWITGPRLALMEREIARMSVVTEARLVEPWWALDFDTRLWAPGKHWPAFLRAQPCVHAEYIHAGVRHRSLLCGAERGGRIRFELSDLLEVDALMDGVPLRWPVAADAQPHVEIRMRAEVRERLAAIPLLPHEWPEQAQDEPTRNAPQPARSALDRLQLALDRPAEWILRTWPEGEAPRVPVRLDPGAPDRALPTAFTDGIRTGAGHWASAAFLLLIGLVAYGKGLSIAFMDMSRRRRGWIGAAILLAFPLWGGWTGTLLQRFAPEAWAVGGDVAADLGHAGAFALERVGDGSATEWQRMGWPVWGAQSAYADLLAPLGLTRPVPPPADADAALHAAAAQVAEGLRGFDDARARAWFEALAGAHRAGQDQAGLLFVEAAREQALDPARSAAVREAASRFLWHFTLSSGLEPHPGQPAYAARLALWQRLTDFPGDPAVAHRAGWVVARAAGDRR